MKIPWSMLANNLVLLGETYFVTFARIKVTLLIVALKNMGTLLVKRELISIPKEAILSKQWHRL